VLINSDQVEDETKMSDRKDKRSDFAIAMDMAFEKAWKSFKMKEKSLALHKLAGYFFMAGAAEALKLYKKTKQMKRG